MWFYTLILVSIFQVSFGHDPQGQDISEVDQIIFGSRKLESFKLSGNSDEAITSVLAKEQYNSLYYYVSTNKGNVLVLEQKENLYNPIIMIDRIELNSQVPVLQMHKSKNQDILFVLQEQITNQQEGNLFLFQINDSRQIRQLRFSFPKQLNQKRIQFFTIYEDFLFLGVNNTLIIVKIDVEKQQIMFINSIPIANITRRLQNPIVYIDVKQGMKILGLCQRNKRYYTLIDISDLENLKIIYQPVWIDHEQINQIVFIDNSDKFIVQSAFYQFTYILKYEFENQEKELGIDNQLEYEQKFIDQGYFDGIQVINQGKQFVIKQDPQVPPSPPILQQIFQFILGLLIMDLQKPEKQLSQLIKKNIEHDQFIIEEFEKFEILIFYEHNELEVFCSVEKNTFDNFPSLFNAHSTESYLPPVDQRTGWPWNMEVFKNNTRMVTTLGIRGIEFFDITNLSNLQSLGSNNPPPRIYYKYLLLYSLDHTFGVDQKMIQFNEVKIYNQDENILFVSNSELGLYVVNIEDLSNLKIINHFQIKGDIDQVVQFSKRKFSNITMLLASGYQGIYSAEMTRDFKELSLLNNVETDESAEGIALSLDENFAYLGIRHYGFQVFDISDIQNLKIIHDIRTQSCEYVHIFEEYDADVLVVSNGIEGLSFYNITEKYEEPVLISRIYLEMSAFRTIITKDRKNLISMGIGQNQIVIIDISDIKNPFMKSQFSKSSGTYCAEIIGNYGLFAFQKPLSVKAFPLIPEIEVNFEFYDIDQGKFTFLKKDEPLYVGQKIEVKAVHFNEIQQNNIVSVGYYDTKNIIQLPNWISFQQFEEQVVMDITKESLGINILVFQTFMQVQEDDIQELIIEQTPELNKGQVGLLVQQIFNELKLQNVIDYQHFLVSVEKSSSIMFLNQTLQEYSLAVAKKLQHYVVNNPIYFKILSSLQFQPENMEEIIATRSQEELLVTLSINKQYGEFLQRQFQGLITSFYDEGELQNMQFSGGIRAINESMKQLRVQLHNKNHKYNDILVKIHDKINEDFEGSFKLNELSFIKVNSPIVLNLSIQEQFDDQMDTENGKVYVEQEFKFQLSPDTFIDADDTVTIQVKYLKDGQYQQIPSNHWLFYASSLQTLTGDPSKKDWKDKSTLKFIATDGYNESEDILVVNPTKFTFWTIFLEVIKILGPILTVILFFYRFRVQTHMMIFYSRFTYGMEIYKPLEYFSKQIPLTRNQQLKSQKVFKALKSKKVIDKMGSDSGSLQFQEYFKQLQVKIFDLKLESEINLQNDYYNLCFKVLACYYLISKRRSLQNELQKLKKFALKEMNSQRCENYWYKYYVDIIPVDINCINEQQIPKVSIKPEIAFMPLFNNLCERDTDIFHYALMGMSLGISATEKLDKKKQGESLLIQESQLDRIIALKKQTYNKGYWMKLKIKLRLNYSHIEMRKNRQLPDWLDYEIENNILHIFGTPPPLFQDDLLIRIQDSHGYILRQFKLQTQEKSQIQTTNSIEGLCPSNSIERSFHQTKNGYNTPISMKRSQLSKKMQEIQSSRLIPGELKKMQELQSSKLIPNEIDYYDGKQKRKNSMSSMFSPYNLLTKQTSLSGGMSDDSKVLPWSSLHCQKRQIERRFTHQIDSLNESSGQESSSQTLSPTQFMTQQILQDREHNQYDLRLPYLSPALNNKFV